MKIALCSDEWHDINNHVQTWLKENGYECILFGSFASHKEEPWVEATSKAARAITNGECVEGIFFCWSGTGASIVANKVPGIRAALCNDPETASLARIWNHANVLVLSNRTLTPEKADALLQEWFKDYDKTIAQAEVNKINNSPLSKLVYSREFEGD
jgi:ribose 5-phosphate isomerase B